MMVILLVQDLKKPVALQLTNDKWRVTEALVFPFIFSSPRVEISARNQKMSMDQR